MKKIMQIVISVCVFLWLFAVSLNVGGQFFIKDIVKLYGSQWTGLDVQLQDASIIWSEKKIEVDGVCLSDAKADLLKVPSVFCASKISIQLPVEFLPDWRRAGLLPDFLRMSLLEIKGASVFYDIDSAGGNFRNLQFQISEASANAMKDRLNARAEDGASPLLLYIQNLSVSDISVDARSNKNPEKSKRFKVEDMVLTDVGLKENGIAAPELLDRIVRVIVERVQSGAASHRLVNASLAHENVRSSRKKIEVEDDREVSDADEKNGVEKAVRSIGSGLKKTSTEIWQGLKKLGD